VVMMLARIEGTRRFGRVLAIWKSCAQDYAVGGFCVVSIIIR
jgi:hypothetical protein